MFLKFQSAERAGGKGRNHLNQNQEIWVQMQSRILRIEPYNSDISQAKGIRKKIMSILTSKQYSFGMSIFPLLILILLMLQNHNATSQKLAEIDFILKKIFLVLAIIFNIEIFVKIYTFRLRGYFGYQWNIIEFIIGIAYIISSFFDFFLSEKKTIIMKCFELLRILPIFRLFRRLKFLRKLRQTITFKLPLILRILSLSLIFLFSYSLLAVFLFSNTNIDEADSLDSKINFTNVFRAMALLFICATGENWSKTLMDTIKYAPKCGEFDYFCGSCIFLKIIN